MIESVHYRNFQFWKSLSLELEQVTTLVAENRSGKSSAFRGLEWVGLNKVPRSRAGKVNLIHWDKDKASVEVRFDSGRRIKRSRTKRSNTYSLDGESLGAVSKGGLPKPIFEALRLTQDNFQQQFQSLFWFAETDAQISRRLNKLVDQEIIDGVSEQLNAMVRKNNVERELVRERVQLARKTIKKTKWAADALRQIEEISKIDEACKNLLAEENLLREVIDTTYKQIDLEKDAKAINGAFKKVSSRDRIIDKLESEEAGLAEELETLHRLYAATADAVPDIKVDKIQASIQELETEWASLTKLASEIESLEKEINRNEFAYTGLIKKYKRVCGPVCPICGKPANLSKLNF